MSKITLCNAMKNIELQYQLTPYQEKKCDQYFYYLKICDLIYPGQLKSRMAIDIKTAYQMLEELKNRGYLSVVYQVRCHNCDRTKEIFLDSISAFNPKYHCDFCGHHLNVMSDLIVLYQVISLPVLHG